jgi:hypothetical protein
MVAKAEVAVSEPYPHVLVLMVKIGNMRGVLKI